MVNGTNVFTYAAPRQTNLQLLPLATYSSFLCFIYSMHNVKGPISGVQWEIWRDLAEFYRISPKSRPTIYPISRIATGSLPQLSTTVTATSFTVNSASA